MIYPTTGRKGLESIENVGPKLADAVEGQIHDLPGTRMCAAMWLTEAVFDRVREQHCLLQDRQRRLRDIDITRPHGHAASPVRRFLYSELIDKLMEAEL